MRIIRVFPRKTKATPDDALARFGPPDLLEWRAFQRRWARPAIIHARA
jgi:hypothetical protein